jgi:hypothetical protein
LRDQARGLILEVGPLHIADVSSFRKFITTRQVRTAHSLRRSTMDVVRRAFEDAGAEFIDENAGAPVCGFEGPKN